LPRSKPQDTRRRLRSAVNHVDKAIQQLAFILPLSEEYKNWDEKYQTLMEFVITFQKFVNYVELMLDEKIIDREVYEEGGVE